MSKKYVQTLTQYLAGNGVIIGATSVTFQSFTDIFGVPLTNISQFGDKVYLTFEPDTTNEEPATATSITVNANGTVTLGGLSTMLAQSPYTETSGLVRQHSGGTKVVITDNVGFWATFANKNNNEVITGLWSAPTGGTGSQIATATDIANAITGASGTATPTVAGTVKTTTTNITVVSTDDTRIPTTNEVAALAGTSGTPVSSSNKFVDNADLRLAQPGFVHMYAGSVAPTGWLFCDGSSLLQSSFAALFAAIGTTFGSADGTHFNLPDMRGRIPVGIGTGTGGGASGTGLPNGGTALTTVPLAGWKGEETHTLTGTESGLPSHSHTLTTFSSGGSTTTVGSGSGSSIGTATTSTAGPTSASSAHNNIQPVMGINFIIKI